MHVSVFVCMCVCVCVVVSVCVCCFFCAGRLQRVVLLGIVAIYRQAPTPSEGKETKRVLIPLCLNTFVTATKTSLTY